MRRVERLFDHAGFRCVVVRVLTGGHLCGYVRLPPAHPWHGLSLEDEPPTPPAQLEDVPVDVAFEDKGTISVFVAGIGGTLDEFGATLQGQVSVHGGLTWAGAVDVGLEKPGEDLGGFWIGFDAAHAYDMPEPEYIPPSRRELYETLYGDRRVWTVDDVADECRRLADQAAVAARMFAKHP